uniref:Uncharacterized protein n=1 Tax=Seriola dumerili TaxID=41447 RepID=A0A3B4TRQ6_SERDU
SRPEGGRKQTRKLIGTDSRSASSCCSAGQSDKCRGIKMSDFGMCRHKNSQASVTRAPYAPERKRKTSIRWTLRVTVARLPMGTAGLLATQVKLEPLSVSTGVMGR